MIYGLIGLGDMGLPFARNIAAAALELIVFDKRRERIEALGGAAASAGSVREIAEQCDVIALLVRDDEQVHDVLVADDGVFQHARPGTTVVIHSTVRPSIVTKLASLAATHSIALVDAAVSGVGGAHVRREAVIVIAGGDTETVTRCRPMFDAIAGKTFHVGGVGAGVTAKLVNNLVAVATSQVLREAIALASAAGIDVRLQLEVICAGSGDCWGARNWDARARHKVEYPSGGPRGAAELAYKDLALAVELSHSLGTRSPMAALASQLITDLGQPFAYGSPESILSDRTEACIAVD